MLAQAKSAFAVHAGVRVSRWSQPLDTNVHERLRRLYIDDELAIDAELATSQATPS